MRILLLSIAAASLLLGACDAPSESVGSTRAALGDVDFDIVYVRYPRNGDEESMAIPAGETPYEIEIGADLMLLHPDGSQEALVDCRGPDEDQTAGQLNCSIQDPVISFDGRWVYYSKYVDMHPGVDWKRETAHAFLFKLQLDVPASDRRELQLTELGDGFATDSLHGNGADDAVGSFGIRDLGATPLPDGRVLFVSNREAIVSFHQGTSGSLEGVDNSLVMQMYSIEDHDGTTPNRDLLELGFSHLHQIQHPTLMQDGRVIFTNWDDVGLRPTYGTATLYTSNQRGGAMHQFLEPHNKHKPVDHFVTELSTGHVAAINYYPHASWGHGIIHRYDPLAGPPFFQRDFQTDEDDYRHFSRLGLTQMTPHTSSADLTAPDLSGRYTTPSAAPDAMMLVAYSGGPVIKIGLGADTINRPRPDTGLYYIANADTAVINDPTAGQLVELLNDPEHNEMWPRAVLPYMAIHGIPFPPSEPAPGPYAPPERDRGLVAGSPIGLTGTSSMLHRETDGFDRFNQVHRKGVGGDSWVIQGAEAGAFTDDDVWGVRLLAIVPDRFHEPWRATDEEIDGLLPDSRMNIHIRGYSSQLTEAWKILGEFQTRNEGTDPTGAQDTSWLARIPANTPFLVQAIDRRGMTLYSEQTWRHVAPGETFADCGGCHAHSVEGVPFEGRAADAPDYVPVDLVNQTLELVYDPGTDVTESRPRTEAGIFGVEFRRDIYPVLDRECRECHAAPDGMAPASGGRVAIFDPALTGFDAEARAYRALAHDSDGTYTPGLTPVAGQTTWFTPQVSRYIRIPQARASLLTWKVYGERLDGRTNEEFPADGDMRTEDLDYVRGTCPAPDRLTADEKRAIARWIDLGAPMDRDRPRMTYTEDHAVPVLTVTAYELDDMTVGLRFGLFDGESGIDQASFSAELTLPDDTTRAVAFADLSFDDPHRVGTLELGIPATAVTVDTPLRLSAEVRDQQGNLERVRRTISRLGPPPPPIPDGGVPGSDASIPGSDAGDAGDGPDGGTDSTSGGCGCRSASNTRSPWGPGLLLACGWMLWQRRRRRTLR